MQRWFIAAMLVAIFAIVVGGAYAVITPDYIEVTPRTLAESVMDEAGGGSALGGDEGQRCRGGPERWSCHVPDTSGSGGGAEYSVLMEDAHCWRARKTRSETDGEPLEPRPEGCVTDDDRPEPEPDSEPD